MSHYLGFQVPPSEVARLRSIEVPGEPVHNLHVTLVYFGEKLSPYMVSEVTKLCAKLAAASGPIPIRVTDITSFRASRHGTPVVARIISPLLNAFRARVARRCDMEGIRYNTAFSYNPHVTLSYAKAACVDRPIAPVSWRAEELCFFTEDEGERVRWEFPLVRL